MGKDQQELFECCRQGDIAKVEALLCSRNRRPRTPLSFLKSHSSWLVSCRDQSTGYTALHVSALHGHAAIVRSLLSYHSQNYDPSSLLCIKDRRGCLPLHLAAWNGHQDVVLALLDMDPTCETVNAFNNAKETPLHLAAQHGQSRVTCELLKRHADPTCRNARGETALDLAARFGRTTVARLLISHCPTLILSAATEPPPPRSPVSYPGTPVSTNPSLPPCSCLHLAARNGHLEIVKILLDSGFDIDWITEEGSALHVAALFGKTPIVRYLLDRGISVHSRDWQGRTVLEVLEEHQNQRSMDLTQLMQNKDAWGECTQLIEERIAQGKCQRPISGRTLESVLPNVPSVTKKGDLSAQLNGSVPPANSSSGYYQNVQGNHSRDLSKSPVWQRVPQVAAQNILSERSKSALGSEAPTETEKEYRPLSVQTLRIKMEKEDMGDLELASTISLTASIDDRCSMSPSADSTISSNATFVLEDFQNQGSVHPVKPPRRNRKPKSTGLGTCPYQAPCGYETWAAPTAKTRPMFGYDNVPSNMLVYDNAPPPGHKKWEHVCGDSSDQDGQDEVDRQNHDVPLLSSSGYDNVHGTESGKNSTLDHSIIEETLQFIAQSCSDLDESLSRAESMGGRSPGRVTFADDADTKAPLAMPELTEDLGGSTTEGEALDVSSSDQQTPGSREYNGFKSAVAGGEKDVSEEVTTPEDPPPSAWASESKIYQKIYPLGEELRRHSSASGGGVSPPDSPSNKEQETQVDGSSDSSGVCSENCSCGDRHSRQISPEKEDDEVPCMTEANQPRKIRMRYGAKVSSASSAPQNSASPLDESAEWEKINDIMESFGGGICRESVFSERYEPRVAVFLQNRQSSALTLTMGDAEAARNSIAFLSPNSGLSPVSKWLKSVGVKQWTEIAFALEANGFDRIDFLKSCLNREILVKELKIEDSELRERIVESLSSLPDFSEKLRLRAHKYVSDWLLSLGCQDYLGLFMKAGLDSVQKILLVKWNLRRLRELGIDSIGHRCRILASLNPADTSTPRSIESGDMWSSTGISSSDFEDSGALITSMESYSNSGTVPTDGQRSVQNEEEETEEFTWKHDSSELIHGWIGYSAHYLGSTLVQVENLEQSEAPKAAITKLKKSGREIGKIPQVLMDISYRGVRLSNAVTKKKICDHEIDHIRCVRQDERDLNCFAYITKDKDRHFCHVFSVLTADVATEIILSLGQAFEVAYQLANKRID